MRQFVVPEGFKQTREMQEHNATSPPWTGVALPIFNILHSHIVMPTWAVMLRKYRSHFHKAVMPPWTGGALYRLPPTPWTVYHIAPPHLPQWTVCQISHQKAVRHSHLCIDPGP